MKQILLELDDKTELGIFNLYNKLFSSGNATIIKNKAMIALKGINFSFNSKLEKLTKHEIFNKHCELEI